MYLLGVDVETTGLDPKKGELLEIGTALFHLETKTIVAQHAMLMPISDLESNPVEHINHISVASIKAVPDSIVEDSFSLFVKMFNVADAIVAHNASFDRRWIEEKSFLGIMSQGKKWICSRYDIDWGAEITSRKLAVIAARMGVPVVSHHRALADVIMMISCLKTLHDLDEQIDRILGKIDDKLV